MHWPAAATGFLACRRLDRCSAAPQLPQLHERRARPTPSCQWCALWSALLPQQGCSCLITDWHTSAQGTRPLLALRLPSHCSRCTESRCIRLCVICVAGDRWRCLQRSRSRQVCERELRVGSRRLVGYPPSHLLPHAMPRVCDSMSCECSDVKSMLVS